MTINTENYQEFIEWEVKIEVCSLVIILPKNPLKNFLMRWWKDLEHIDNSQNHFRKIFRFCLKFQKDSNTFRMTKYYSFEGNKQVAEFWSASFLDRVSPFFNKKWEVGPLNGCVPHAQSWVFFTIIKNTASLLLLYLSSYGNYHNDLYMRW